MLEILIGKAGAGKTARCLQIYREALQKSGHQGRVGEVLWLAPTHRAAQAVLRELLNTELTCCWAPGVMTFEQFAERVLRGSGQAASMLNPAQRRMLIKAVIQQAEQAGELVHFRRISQTNGFASQLGRFITELKRDETWPEAWLETIPEDSPSLKDRELGQLYQRYQNHLLKWNKYDSEGRFWLARTQLAQGNWQAFPNLSLVVVDGFTDFTRTQQEMLILLARKSSQLKLTLPGDSVSAETAAETSAAARPDLFFRSVQTCQMLKKQAERENLPCQVKQCDRAATLAAAVAVETLPPAGLQKLADHLFGNPRQIRPATAADGIECVAALGPRAEVREVARRVKELLLAKVPAENILVTVRQLENYAVLIESLWQDAGIPHRIDQSRPVTALPLARSLMALYDVLKNDWSFASLKKLLRQTPLRLSQLEDTEQGTRAALRMLRFLNLRGGRYEILESLQALVIGQKDLNAAVGEEDETPVISGQQSVAELALATFQQLDQALKPLQRSAAYEEQTQQLLATARELFFSEDRTTEPQRPVNEVSGPVEQMAFLDQWDLLAGMLREAAEFQDLLTENKRGRVRWQNYADWLSEQFRFQSLPPRKAEAGEVLILEASDARHLAVPWLFVMGLHEGSFPGRGDNQPFYSDAERQRWNQQGIPLNNRNSHHQEEMQFFYRLVTRAQQQLTLTYSRVTGSGGPQYASPFYQGLRSLFAAGVLPEQALGNLSPVPEDGVLLTQADIRLQAAAAMTARQPGLLSWWSTQAARQRSFRSLLATVRMNSCRFEEPGFTAYEGMLSLGGNRQMLQAHYHASYTFSASRLESYATCPFRYFLESVLEVEPLQSPRLATDYLRRGNLIHDILAELHTEQWQPLLNALHSDDGQALSEKYLELLQQRFDKKYRRSELQQALDQIEQQLLEEWAGLYSRQTADYYEKLEEQWEQKPLPRYREISFGKNRSETETSESTPVDPVLPAVKFGPEEAVVYLEGRIDRIDVGRINGQDVFTIIDYKTGAPPKVREEQVLRGTQLQLALYVVAVMRLELVGPEAIPWLAGYWGIREAGFQPQFKVGRKKTLEPLTEQFLTTWEKVLDELIPRLVEAMRQGEFPVFNQDQNCTGRCPYRTVCRVNQTRAVADSLHKTWQIPLETDLTTEASSPAE